MGDVRRLHPDDQQITTTEQIPGGPREDVPSALKDPRDARFEAPLVDIDELASGGPPPDGIPPIDDPLWLPARDIEWLEDQEPVLLVELNGQARAYPVQIMMWHELVNDTILDTPVTVSYCPLCNSAITFERRADGRVFDYGTSGMLYQSAMVMYDRQTESLWSHFTGQAIIGFLIGTQLSLIPTSTISWDQFRQDHAAGLVLSKQTGYERDYGRNPYPGYDDVGSSPFLFRGPVDDRLLAKTRVVGLRSNGDAVAIPLDSLASNGVMHATVGAAPVVVLHTVGLASALDGPGVADGRDIGQTRAYRALVDSEELTLRKTDLGWEDQMGTTWSFLGRAIAGPNVGMRLEPIEYLDTFWFAWAAFMPNTRIQH